MSAHTGSKWYWTDPIEESLISNIAGCVKHHGYASPLAYGLFCAADQLVYNIGKLLEVTRTTGDELTREVVETFIPEEFEYRSVALEVTEQVLEKLDLLGKKLTKAEMKCTLPDKISLPNIRIPYPNIRDIVSSNPIKERL